MRSNRSFRRAVARRPLFAFVAVAATLGSVAAAASASPGAWTQLPQSERSAQGTQVWPLRLPDGSLEVAYPAPNADGVNTDLLTALIGRTGTVAAAAPIVSGWSGTTNAALILQPGGIAAFFGGFHSGDPADPNQDLNVASAPGAGGPWTVAPGSASATDGVNDDQAYASDPSVVALADGTPIEAWAHTLAVSVHSGIGAAEPNQDFQAAFGGCCGSDVALALDGAGAPALAWFSGAAGHTGYYVQDVDPASGAPVGTAALVPGSQIGGTSAEPRAHTALTGRPGRSGLFTALAGGYPVQSRVLVWRQGAPTSMVVAHDAGSVGNVAIAADPAGRLWVVWTGQGSGGTEVFASRSNPDVTKFDSPVAAKLPAGAAGSYALAASAQVGVVDVIGTFGPGPGGAAVAVSATQLQPGEDVRVAPVRVKRGRPAVAVVKVSDAGVPLAGAAVTRVTGHASSAARPALTNARGTARLKLGSFRHTTTLRLRIAKHGHATRTVSLRVRVR